MEIYIAQENIRRFTLLLSESLDPMRRKMVLRLLSLEQAKLADLLKAEEIRSEDVERFTPDHLLRQNGKTQRA